ncbi:two-component system, response regulator, stage 0 sporulation protein F [Desulfotomaculum arcticum]|uniref:Stage 0 sporulation protein A homolog n=1 Tax=Desulfotruncus arcticus DSM 17038 TaxID=1121424 RepID=A0A1I2VEM0_9FIRM|nr:response regulator [Desulfotruncus arcticus]SFG87523.1 two-component system, response regulator, stage 0 sporulation protein F [Desulfotomaculum arcticum] [Desulfotruncus arcticus DSM 17038]
MTQNTETLLVVDDQSGVRRLICEALLDDGHLVEQAPNGLEALKKLAQKKYQLILLDIKMPGMNGLETLTEIRKIDPGIPVIMMTAYGELDILEKINGKGVDHISKPFDLNELRSLVKAIISRGVASQTGIKTG